MGIRELDRGNYDGLAAITRGNTPRTKRSLVDVLNEAIDVLNTVTDIGLETFVTLYVDDTNGDDTHDGLAASKSKKTINAALDAIPMFSTKDYFIKLAPGTYDEDLILAKHRGATINFIGSLVVEHSGTVVDYKSTGLNPVGFHQVEVAGFTFEASDDEKWLRFDFDDGTHELVKILTVLSTSTVEVGAARLYGKVDADYEDEGIGGHTTGVHLVSEGVTVGTDQSRIVQSLGSGPMSPSDEINFLGAFYSFFGIRFSTSNSYGAALYIHRALNSNLFFTACSLRCPDYFSLYVVDGSFQIFIYPANGYLGTAAKAEYDRLTDDVFSNITYRAGLYMDGSTHVYNSPTSWLNLRSCVHFGDLYMGDWQSFSMLYPREHGLVIKKKAGLTLRVDDRGGAMIRGRILVNGPALVKALSDVSMTADLVMEWRASTGGVPLRIEGGGRGYFPTAVFTIDNDEAGAACIEVEDCPVVQLGDVTITGAPTGVAPIEVSGSKVTFKGDLAAPSQDYGVAPAGGIVRCEKGGSVAFEGAATGKNTNAGDSSPLVLRTKGAACLPASGYDLKDNADVNTVYLGTLGNGEAIPASGACKNDLLTDPAGTEELTIIHRD